MEEFLRDSVINITEGTTPLLSKFINAFTQQDDWTHECRQNNLSAGTVLSISRDGVPGGCTMVQVHLILRHKAANMTKAMKEASLPDLGCFAHTLQLMVHNGVLSQQAVTWPVLI
uniref:Uncharacterized protein n=1 Tax=Amphimedon queenslandica TaxID=400682 RepID=A0A1X7UKQ1_AMPQE